MSIEGAMRALSARVIVVGNEKGGSGKSTVAMHIAIALIKSGQAVATIDLDTRQKSLTHHIENRRAWARHVGRDLGMPQHFCFQQLDYPSAEEQAAGCRALEKTVETLAGRYGVVIIDTPGHDDYLTHVAHAMADTLDHAAQRQLRRSRRARHRRSRNLPRHRHQPLCRDGGGSARQAPRALSRRHRLDRAAQPALDARLAQQAPRRREHPAAVTAAELPLHRWPRRTRDFSRVLSAGPHRRR